MIVTRALIPASAADRGDCRRLQAGILGAHGVLVEIA